MDEGGRREVGLFRYAPIREAADPGLSKAERGRLVRARSLLGSMLGPVVGWSGWRAGRWMSGSARIAGVGLRLVPKPRVVAPRTPPGMLELAFRLKLERPQRTAA